MSVFCPFASSECRDDCVFYDFAVKGCSLPTALKVKDGYANSIVINRIRSIDSQMTKIISLLERGNYNR